MSARLGLARLGLLRLGLEESSFGIVALTQEVSDSFSLTDAIVNSQQTAVSDSYTLSDSIATAFLIYTEPILIQVADVIELIEGFQAYDPINEDDFTFQVMERILFYDEIVAAAPLSKSVDDTLDLSDAAEFHSIGYAEGYDTLFYNWADEVRVVLEQTIETSDTLALSDAVATALTVVGIPIEVSDSYTLTDALTVRIAIPREINDSFVLSDDIELFGTVRNTQADLLALSDAINTFSSNSQDGQADSYELSDNVAVSLATITIVALTKTVSDTIALSDTVSSNRSNSNLNYLRRYLNDVIR